MLRQRGHECAAYATLVAIHNVVPPASYTPPRLSSPACLTGSCPECGARLNRRLVGRVNVAGVDMPVRRHGRPPGAAVSDHQHRVVDANLSVHDVSRGVWQVTQFDCAEYTYEESNRVTCAIDNQLG